jgi:hypothetical protein
MVGDPLHREPTRPAIDRSGELTNPLGPSPVIRLDSGQPVGFEDLRPSTSYRSPRFEYLTDENGLPARVWGALRIVAPGERVRHVTSQRDVGHLHPGTHGGHIVAVSLGGHASGPNLFPQAANFNVSAYARLENGWRAALAEGHTVEVDIALTVGTDPRYRSSSSSPSGKTEPRNRSSC